MGLFKRIMADKKEQSVTTKQQIGTSLSQRDSIEKLNLMEHSFNALTHAGVQTVGQLLKLVESSELRSIHGLRSTSILEIEVKLAQLEIVDNSEVEANPNATPDQNDVPLSREVPIEKSSLTQSPPNQLHVDSQAVREVEQQVKSGESATISESDANVDTMPAQNDASLSQEDATEEPSLPQHSPNPLIHTESQTVGEGIQHVESAEIQTISEDDANTDTTPDENSVSLSREDSIERLSLTRHTLNLLKHTDIRKVGDLLQWVESGRLQTIPALGRISILEIEDELTRINSLDDSGVEANLGATPNQNDVSFSQEDSTEEPSLPQHSPNPQIHTESQTVGEGTQHIESAESQTIAEAEVNVDAIPDQNEVSLSQEDSTEEPSMTEHSPNPPIHTESQTVGEGTQHIESSELQTISEGEADTNETSDRNDVPLSREDSTKKIRLTRDALNRLKQTDVRTVGELLQWVESGKPHTTPALEQESISEIKGRLAQAKTLDDSETEANTNTTPDQNDVPLSQEDSAEEPSLPQHSRNLLTHTDSQTVGEVTQQIESTEIPTISEAEVNIDTIPDQNDAFLSREDSIEKLNLTAYSFNALTALDIQTVGEVLKLVESGEHRPISTLGRKFILEIEGKLAQVKILDDSETEANTDPMRSQDNVSLSRKDLIEEPSLTQHSSNLLTHTESQTVGETAQQVESSEIQTISEGEANIETIPDQNEVSLSREESTEEQSLTEHSLNPLIHTESQTVEEATSHIELGEIQTISEVEANTNVISDRDYGHLSLEDSIERLNLRNRSFDALTRAGIRTVGETAQLVKSGRLATIPALGTKSILEIENKMAQVEILDDSEVEKAADPHAEEHSTTSVESQSENNMGIQPGFQSNSEEDSTAPGEDEADAKPIETKPQSDSQTDAVLRKTWVEIFKITKRLAQVKTLQNTLFLREDPIEKMNLSEHSFNALRRVGIRTVGEVLHLIESIRLKTIRELGAKCILEIMEILTQVKIFNDSEVRWLLSSVWNRLVVKILNDSEVEIKRRKDEILERVIRGQSHLVRKHLSRELLHEDAIIAGQSIKSWLAEMEATESNQAYEVLEAILGSSVNICEEIEFFLNQIPIQYRMTILLSTYGLETKNLRQTGDELGLSRERVRQIRNELKDKATSISNRKFKPALLRMQSALLIAEDLGLDITYDRWSQRIRSSGLVGDWTSQDFVGADAVEVMIAICNLLADCKIRWLQMPENLQYAVQLAIEGKPNVPAKIPHARDTLSDEVKRLINRHTKFSGGVHAKWLSEESERELEEIKDILQGLEYRMLSKDWFAPDQISYSDVFHRCLRQMFQYCGQLGIDDVCAGIRHGVSRSGFSEPEYLVSKGVVQSRSVFPVPPPDVMAEILRIDGYQCDDELYYWDGAYDENLSKGETIIMNCLEQIGPVLHHSELAHAFIESNLSFPLLHVTLNSSPLFDKVESALYKLRGREVTYQDIERAQAAGEPQSLSPEVGYDTDGNIIVSVTLSTIAVGSGTIFCERFPDLSGADWECYVGSERTGELSAVENEFRRLKKSFELLNCQPGERLKFIFNAWKRTVTIEKDEKNAKD